MNRAKTHDREQDGEDGEVEIKAPSSLVKYAIAVAIGAGVAGGGGIVLRNAETGGESPAVLVSASRELQEAKGEIATLRSRVTETERVQGQTLETLRAIQATQARMAGTMDSMWDELKRMSDRKSLGR